VRCLLAERSFAMFEEGDVVWGKQLNSKMWPCKIVSVTTKKNKKPVYTLKYLQWGEQKYE
jgi:hypothetical protein